MNASRKSCRVSNPQLWITFPDLQSLTCFPPRLHNHRNAFHNPRKHQINKLTLWFVRETRWNSNQTECGVNNLARGGDTARPNGAVWLPRTYVSTRPRREWRTPWSWWRWQWVPATLGGPPSTSALPALRDIPPPGISPTVAPWIETMLLMRKNINMLVLKDNEWSDVKVLSWLFSTCSVEVTGGFSRMISCLKSG